MFTFAGCALSWKANLQSVVALSTTESEYIAIAKGVKEALWLKNLSEELGLDTQSFLINSDSQSAIHLSKNIRYHEKTKHISIRYHFLRSVVSAGEVDIVKIHTSENPADMLTKCLPIAKFHHSMELISVREH